MGKIERIERIFMGKIEDVCEENREDVCEDHEDLLGRGNTDDEEEENLREGGEGSDYGTDLSEFNDAEADYVDAYEDQECPDVADEDTQSSVDWCGTFQNTPGCEDGDGISVESEYEENDDLQSVAGAEQVRTHQQWDKMEVEAGGEGGEEGGEDVVEEEAGMLKRKLSKTPSRSGYWRPRVNLDAEL
ncbi:hypothetical protein CJ030_MR1G020577 [Morella rubra]|uniref:Uncharacterized protein n=1 Tax=Morella rubra TaxID=262757 RepID=A0A6A1WUE7_9ROSI|nr:hypothetical protein CJ030_MR1G020577 [Morella rubra]